MAKIEVEINDRYNHRKPEVLLHQLEAPEWEARLASILIERWGIVAGMPDGEDSRGRARVRKATPVELVTEACETAALAVAEFRKRGWVVNVPTLAERNAAIAAQEKAGEDK